MIESLTPLQRHFNNKNGYVSNFSLSNLKNVENSDHRWRFKSRNSLPIKYLREYDLETENIRVGIFQSRKIPACIPINEELCRLLGYFLAEGSYQNGLVFSFNRCEEDLVEDVNYIIKFLFGISPSIRTVKGNEHSIHIDVQSKNLEMFADGDRSLYSRQRDRSPSCDTCQPRKLRPCVLAVSHGAELS